MKPARLCPFDLMAAVVLDDDASTQLFSIGVGRPIADDFYANPEEYAQSFFDVE